ncbi:MAG TPA: tRNA lysidine(34) synthetase TilS [Caulobacteraceae bacterium]|jgi:tRNA(Ile)-lysidine synthase|nr:tRNA lysidine(34) synthetase TilS [Caulobacteraceae bacterium]
MIAAAANAVFDRRLDADSSAPVALALSGGGDSLALLGLAAHWCRARGRPLLALTIDHGLHPDSAAWTRAAGEAAAHAGAAWRALPWDGPKPASGLPAAARMARHRLLAEAARAAGARVLLIGHTRDDALEGELMREADVPGLGRLGEWTPSPVWPEGRDLFLLRPLLDQRRPALRAWLAERGQAWLDDPANEDLRHPRARARVSLRPSGEKGDAKRPDEGVLRPPHPTSIDAAAFSDGRLALPQKSLPGRLLAAALLCAAGTSRPPRGEPLERLLTRLQAGGPVQATLAGARIVADGETVQIGRDAGERFRNDGLAPLSLKPGTATVWDGRFELVAVEPGWTVLALGGAIARLGAHDRRRLKRIPPWARGAAPALADGAGSVRLPIPFGDGPVTATSLAGPRLAAACGLIAHESGIADSRHGADAVLTLCSGPVD